VKNVVFSSIYGHLPFCEVICHYCDFYTDRSAKADHERLASAMALQALQGAGQFAPILDTVYLGGGTPSKTPPDCLEKILAPLRPRLNKETEITLECNPSDCKPDNVRAWRSLGFNRASLGIQSLDDKTLKQMGRNHSRREALDALACLLEHFPSVSADLIYGIPDQDEGAPAAEAQELMAKGVHHLSAYHLTLNEKHFLFKRLPEGEAARAQLEALRRIALEKGFTHYEVSNFCTPGHASRHNQVYWTGRPYWAMGPSAHGYDGLSRRWQIKANWRKYCEEMEGTIAPEITQEELTEPQRQMELLFTSLRTEAGLPRAAWIQRFGWDLGEVCGPLWGEWAQRGWALPLSDRMRLSFAGQMLTDSLVLALLKQSERLDR
jgi:oxygen-independent coproporphyrinogen III oxidase